MNRVVVLLVALVGLLLLLGGYFTSARNEFVTMEENIRARWAQVDNQLQRRADLIPNLVETVKGYASHEREVLGRVADARAKLAGARSVNDRIAADNELSSALARLLVVVENYPNLKADSQFTGLRTQLEGTENRLAVERRRYNEAVQGYNTTLRRFPGSLVASLAGFRESPYFQVPEAARAAPQVKF